MCLLGILFGAGLAYASKKFAVVVDPKVEALINALPGINCGACGYPGCSGYAAAIAVGEAEPNLCSPGGADTVNSISDILGVDITAAEPKIAFIKCKGAETAVKESIYTGVQTCALAATINKGFLACKYACLMLGDCMFVCQFDAITWSPNNIPVIDETKCTACGKCILVCSKNIIELRPNSKRILVLCSSEDKGAIARKNCKTACIACTKCVKACPVDAIEMKNNVAVLDTEKCVLCGKCVSECPTGVIWDGRPDAEGENQAPREQPVVAGLVEAGLA